MKINKNLLILGICLVGICALLLINTTAETRTTLVVFKEDINHYVDNDIGNDNYISTFYYSGYSPQEQKNRHMFIGDTVLFDNSTYKIITAEITFTKTLNNKTTTMTKTYKANEHGSISDQAPEGWEPHSAIVTYELT